VLTNTSAEAGAAKIVDVRTTAYEVLQIINGASPTTPPATGDQE
jgi:hypothetical protein